MQTAVSVITWDSTVKVFGCAEFAQKIKVQQNVAFIWKKKEKIPLILCERGYSTKA